MDELSNTVPCGIIVFDDGGTILSVNKTLADMLGYDADAMPGKSIDTILSLASRIFYNTHFFPLIRLHSKADEIFLTLITRNKQDIPVLSNTVRRLKGSQHENVTVFIPVLQRKKYEDEILAAKRTAERALSENKALQSLTQELELRTRELEKQNQRIEAVNRDLIQFSKLISHDLQEPIRKIKLFTSVLSSAVDDGWPPRNISSLERIEHAAEKLRTLTYGLQEYVSLSAHAAYEKVDLNQVLAQALKKATQKREFDAFHITNEHLPTIDGSSAQLELLFLHLIDNAIQFRQPDKELRIRITATRVEENLYRSLEDRYKFMDYVRIAFSDNGAGFDNQYSDYVFDLGKKAHVATQGLGLGLALIKKIVDNHEGTVTIESDPGMGTKVVLVLPMAGSTAG